MEWISCYGWNKETFQLGVTWCNHRLFSPGKVIPGWDLGLMKLSQGEKALLTVPAALAYGPRGFGNLGLAKGVSKGVQQR